MMLPDTPTVCQTRPCAVAALDDHPGHRGGALLGGEDAHLVVDQLHPLERGVGLGQRLAQRVVERVHRAVAVGHGVEVAAADRDLDRRLRGGDQLAHGVEAALVDDAEAQQLEIVRHLAQRPPDQHLEAGGGPVIDPAPRLALLDQRQELGRLLRVGVDVEAHLGEAEHQVGAAGLVGDQDVAGVADQRRVDVLVEGRALGHRRGVQARLVGEGRGADVGRVPVRACG